MAPSRTDKGKGKAIDDSTCPDSDRPNKFNFGRSVPTPKENINFMLAFRNRSQTAPKYSNVSSFPTSSFDSPKFLNHQGLGILILYFGPYLFDLVSNFYCYMSIGNG